MKIGSPELCHTFHVEHEIYVFLGFARPHAVKPPDFPVVQTMPQKILRPEGYLEIPVVPVHVEQEYLGLSVVRSDDEQTR